MLLRYYHAFAAIYGHHHYSHAYNFKELKEKSPIYSDQAASKSREFYNQLKSQNYAAMGVTSVWSDNMVQIEV